MSVFAAIEVNKRVETKPVFSNPSKGVSGELIDDPTFTEIPTNKETEKEALIPSGTLDFKVDEELEKKMQNLWIIDGQAYDFRDFVKRHPGGTAAISLGKGLDCTELFKTYHLMKTPPESILKKYRVPNPEGMKVEESKYSFDEDGFLMTVRRRGRQYFESNNLSSKGSMFWQVLAVLSIFVIGGLMYPAFYMGSVIAALVHGLCKGLTAVGAGHSMSHFSLFTKPWMNSFVFRVFSPLVISTHQIWSTSHVVSHHIHTLTPDDLQDNYPVKRVQPALPHRWFHRFQHVYIWIVYLFGLPLWTLSDLIDSIPVLFTGRHKMRRFTLLQRLENTLVLTFNIFITIVLPFIFLPFWNALIVCLCSNVPSSLMLVIQIAVNHEVPECMSKTDPNKKKIDWGTHQVLTSHDFGVNSSLALHFSGGLNMQIEHHIFPSVHYVHYPALAKIVQQACLEFNLPYNTSKHLFEAVSKHYQLLKHCTKP
jgi:fatty acid desaturase